MLLVLFAALAIALRPLLPGHRAEINLWVHMCVFLAAMAWLVRMAMERRVRLVRTGMGLPALLLLAIATVSTIRSPHPVASLATLLEWLSYAVLFFVLVNAAAEGLDRRFFLRVLWASAFVVVLYGLFQQFVNLPLLRRQIQVDPQRVLVDLRMSGQHLGHLMARATRRIFATFLLSNSFAGFLALVTPGFVGHVLDRLRAGRASKPFLAASALWVGGALACLLFTYSKGGWAAFAVGALAFCAMLGKGLVRRHLRLLGALAAAVVLVVGLLFVVRVIPVQIFRDAWPSLEFRLGYWRGALGMACDHPWGGVGLGAFGTHYPRYRPLLAHMAQSTHNDYLQVLAELGIPGLALFLCLWAAYLRNVFTIRPELAPSFHPQHRTPNTEPRRGGPDKAAAPALAYLACVLAFALSTTVMATFALAGWEGDTWWGIPKPWLDRALVLAFAVAWVFFFAALGRDEGSGPGDLCRKGLVCGLIAFLFHCLVDFDYTEPGVAFTAWVVAALSVAPRGPALERPLRRVPAFALGAGVILALFVFQFVLLRVTGAATDRDVAASYVSEMAGREEPSLPRAELLRRAQSRYERAIRANPLDDALRVEYAGLLVSLLVPPETSNDAQAPPRAPAPGTLRVRIKTVGEVALFRRAVELYERAAELNRHWAAPHTHLSRLFEAAADAGAREPLLPFVPRYSATRPPSGPSAIYLPAVAEAEAALRTDPNNPALLLLLAAALEKHGDLDATRKLLERSLELHRMLHAKHPGHVLCLTPQQAHQAAELLQRLDAERPAP